MSYFKTLPLSIQQKYVLIKTLIKELAEEFETIEELNYEERYRFIDSLSGFSSRIASYYMSKSTFESSIKNIDRY